MKYFGKKKKLADVNFLDMSSLMDIIFILLIFVMVSISFSKDYKVIDMTLPETKEGNTPETEEHKSLTISLKADGSIYYEKEKIGLEDLKLKMAGKEMQKREVYLNIEKKYIMKTL